MNMIKQDKMFVTPSYDGYNIAKKSNHKDMGDFISSKMITSKVIRLLQCGDNINERNVIMSNIKAKEQLHQTERKLAKVTDLGRGVRRNFNEKWEELIKNQENFRNDFINFDKFIQENVHKRKRTQKKLNKQNELLETTTNNVENHKKDYSNLEELKELMEKDTEKLQIYQKYLSDVVARYPKQFANVDNIIERFESLRDARKELHAFQEKTFNELEQLYRSWDLLVDDYYTKVIGLNTKLATLNQRYDIARANCIKWENIHNNIAVQAIEKYTATVAIKDSCWRIYKEICERKGLPLTRKNNVSKQFELIKDILYQYECVNMMVNNEEEQRQKLSEKACASTEIK